MKAYDFEKAKDIILKQIDLESAELGMKGDWFWTSDTVFMNNKFIVHFPCEIAGITSSHWATPSLLLKYKNGFNKFLDCYIGNGIPAC